MLSSHLTLNPFKNLQFNDLVFADLVHVVDAKLQGHDYLVVIDQATSFCTITLAFSTRMVDTCDSMSSLSFARSSSRFFLSA